jgi:hypothetical protein
MKIKWTGDVGQVVELPALQAQALSSNSSTNKKKEKERVCSGASIGVYIEGKGEDQQESGF